MNSASELVRKEAATAPASGEGARRIKVPSLQPVLSSVYHRDIRELLRYAARTYANDDAFIVKHKGADGAVTYEHVSFARFLERINHLGAALLARGLQGKRIAILGKNCIEWLETYFATLGGLGISVPLDKGLPYEELESSLRRSRADVLVFDPALVELVEKLQAAGSTDVQLYFTMDRFEGYVSIPELREEGEAIMDRTGSPYPDLPVDPDAMSILLFTSGTTALSKAVCLSQRNITFDIYSMLQVEDIRRGDVCMAFLPFHHTFGCTGEMVMLAAGTTTTFCDGLKYLQKNIVEYHVSLFVCVPLLIESIYKRIMATVKKEGLERKVAMGRKLSRLLLKLGIDVRRKLFKQILDQLGGNLRYVISGASALDPVAMQGFKDFGIEAVQGYGMTEASPCIASEACKEQRPGSIGRAMPGVEVAIEDPNEDGVGELIAKGPNIMLGYYENEEETAAVLQDGWLHTGDLAYLDKDGFLFLCGRKKNVIVLKNGKNVYPEEIELLLANLPYMEESMVYGEPRRKGGDEKDLALCAKLVYKPDVMEHTYGLKDPAAIEAKIRADVDELNRQLPVYKQLLRLVITDQPMSKTTTGKVKRYEELKKNPGATA